MRALWIWSSIAAVSVAITSPAAAAEPPQPPVVVYDSAGALDPGSVIDVRTTSPAELVLEQPSEARLGERGGSWVSIVFKGGRTLIAWCASKWTCKALAGGAVQWAVEDTLSAAQQWLKRHR